MINSVKHSVDKEFQQFENYIYCKHVKYVSYFKGKIEENGLSLLLKL